jgi:alginate O-acetyltransferase complex protein AlgI
VIALALPEPLFNPLTSSELLAPTELLAGPLGLVAFLPLIPIVWLLGRRAPRTALIVAALAWLLPTLWPLATVILLAWVTLGAGWVLALHAMRRRGVLGHGVTIALVWVGLHALALPLWWQTRSAWYPSPMAALHSAGFAYLLLRMIAWGVDVATTPGQPVRLGTTVCWLLYPPCMRLGPVVRREAFLERFDAWVAGRSPEWIGGLKRLGLCLLGGVAMGVIARQLPPPRGDGLNYFADPETFSTAALVRVFYLVPIQTYLMLWTYNELAAALSRWVGIRVDDNFRWLPTATSIRDFWRRWHVTVGAWLRDYAFIPLGGSRHRVYLNYFLVFAYCGIWHGPVWSFLAWGMSQAVALCVERGWDTLRRWRGWPERPGGVVWTVGAWLLTMHYQMATIVVFFDFEHCGWRLLTTLATRIVGGSFEPEGAS